LLPAKRDRPCFFRRFGFSPWLLSPQAALHVALELRHELIRAERTTRGFRSAQARQRGGLLQLSVDACRDSARTLSVRKRSVGVP
jgi:hypothetical protein